MLGSENCVYNTQTVTYIGIGYSGTTGGLDHMSDNVVQSILRQVNCIFAQSEPSYLLQMTRYKLKMNDKTLTKVRTSI